MLVRRFSGSQKTVFNDEQFKRRELIILNSPYQLEASKVYTGLTIPQNSG